MGFQGLAQFKENLDILMESDAFKSADEGERLNLGYRLINSKYGGVLGSKVEKLPESTKPRDSSS